MMAGSILTSKSMSLPPVTDLSAPLSASRFLSLSFSATVTSRGHLALVAGDQRAVAADHVAHGEQPAVGGDDAQEIGGEPADAGLVEDGGERAQLLVGAEHRAAHQPIEIGIVGDQRVEAVEIGLDGIDRLVVERQLEQSIGVTPCHAGNDRIFACHWTLVFVTSFTGRTPSQKGGANYWNPRGNSDS